MAGRGERRRGGRSHTEVQVRGGARKASKRIDGTHAAEADGKARSLLTVSISAKPPRICFLTDLPLIHADAAQIVGENLRVETVEMNPKRRSPKHRAVPEDVFANDGPNDRRRLESGRTVESGNG